MEEYLTKKGVLIDVCSSCRGVWLDQGELFFFAKDKSTLKDYKMKGLEETHKIRKPCPRCESAMQMGRIPSFSYQVEECLSCKGLFFSSEEFKKLQSSKNFQTLRKDFSDVLNKKTLKELPSSISIKLPSLFFAMGVTCCSLYGLLFAVFVLFMELTNISLLTCSSIFFLMILLQFYFAPIILDWQLSAFGSLHWRWLENLPPDFKKSLLKLCKEHKLPIPKIGIIKDKSPQAYTYGRTPYSARLVFSSGMFELLDKDELEAVLAHELGHIKHWDFVVMTIVKVVPLLLYTIYRKLKNWVSIKEHNTKNDEIITKLRIVMIVSYLAYFISEYLVLFVSRIREYHADRFSCFATKKPNKLLTALVRIAYGLTAFQTSTNSKTNSDEDKVRAVEALNIMNVSRSKNVVLTHQVEQNGENVNLKAIEESMRWDLWNPWAFYYELNSTHPLTAKRINAINAYAIALKQQPYFLFKEEKPESYWDDFFIDLFILSLPYILGFGSVLLWVTSKFGFDYEILKTIEQPTYIYLLMLFIFFLSFGALIRTRKSYPKEEPAHCSVASLLKLIKVSPVRSYYVTLKGQILGRGDAGNIFSEDFILKDKTGIIFLNHEPFGLNILFALFRYKKFQGKEVIVTGWYRRSPTPYIEIKSIKSAETKSQAYTYHYKIGLCILGLLIPIFYINW